MQIVINFLVAALLSGAGFSDGSGDPLKIKPVQTMAGGNSGIRKPMVRMISAQAQWQELWNLHKGIQPVVSDKGELTYPNAPAAPTVDFTKNQVLVVFGGKLPDVQAYDYVKTYAKDDIAVVQLAQNMVTSSKEATTMTPYIIMVIPKEPVAIEVELDSIAKDGSHFWLKIASYRAPKPKAAG